MMQKHYSIAFTLFIFLLSGCSKTSTPSELKKQDNKITKLNQQLQELRKSEQSLRENNQNLQKEIKKIQKQLEDSLQDNEQDEKINNYAIFQGNGYRFHYPTNMIAREVSPDAPRGIKLVSQDYEETGDVYEIKRGFKISLSYGRIPEKQDWLDLVKSPGGSIGNGAIYQEIKVNNEPAYKKVAEGNAFLASENAKIHVSTTIFIPNKNKEHLFEINLISLKEDNDDNLLILEEIVNSLELE